MCVILIGKAAEIYNLDLESAWETNSDGAGFLVRKGVNSYVVGGIMTLTALMVQLEKLDCESKIVLHLRMATHGAVAPRNCHPFRMGDAGWLFHNGVADGFGAQGTHKGAESDSAHLARVLGRVTHRDRLAILNAVGGKFALLDNRGGLTTVGTFTQVHGTSVMASNMYWQYPAARWISEPTRTAITYSNHGWYRDESGAWTNDESERQPRSAFLDRDTEEVESLTARQHADAIVKAAGRAIAETQSLDEEEVMICS